MAFGLGYKTAFLLGLVCAAEASFFKNWNTFDNSYGEKVNAQAVDDSCQISGAHGFCQSAKVVKGEQFDYFHICPKDGDLCESPNVCYDSSVPECCQRAILTSCNSTSILNVLGVDYNVTFYNVNQFEQGFITKKICFVATPKVEICDDECKSKCLTTILCQDNAVSCDLEAGICTQCKEGYEPNDCCDCSLAGNQTHRWYKHENGSCLPICRLNCLVAGDNSPCFNCLEGYMEPSCCECNLTGNDTHAFYKDENGHCLPFCKLHCVELLPGGNGCRTCEEGYVSSPECCDCDTEGNATHAYYKTSSGECKPFCKLHCVDFLPGVNGCRTCKEGYVSSPECCDCDTEGNATHAYYKTSSDECKPFCKLHCVDFLPGGNGCRTCEQGYASSPECCDCDTKGNATHAYYKTSSGECKPFCKLHCVDFLPGGNGCETCEEGYALSPECCDCDTGGNATHAYYKTSTGECKPFCKLHCVELLPGGNGCRTCEEGYVSSPECCDCDTEGNATHAYYKTSSGECKPFCKLHCVDFLPGGNGCRTCEKEYVSSPECCDCDTEGNGTHAYYKTSSGECKSFCKLHCVDFLPGGNGCQTCEEGYVSSPECCDCDTDAGYSKTDDECKKQCGTKEQSLFFLIDASISNDYDKFCHMMIVFQMLAAAFNPSGVGLTGTKLYGTLFPRFKPDYIAPTEVFTLDAGCNSIVNTHALDLVDEYYKCKTFGYDPKKDNFSSMCGQHTKALEGLKKILGVIKSSQFTSIKEEPKAVIILTDGIIYDDDITKVEAVKKELIQSNVKTMIAASLAYDWTLQKYVIGSTDNAIFKSTLLDLGKSIVQRLKAEGFLCQDYANKIIDAFDAALSNINVYFCHCLSGRKTGKCKIRKKLYNVKYTFPTCGGDLDVDLTFPKDVVMQEGANGDLNLDLDITPPKDVVMQEGVNADPDLLEEEIFAAVEKVLDNFPG